MSLSLSLNDRENFKATVKVITSWYAEAFAVLQNLAKACDKMIEEFPRT
jgi:hypothetical protein